ncbi:MAG: DUF1501 domain-containing protein, partial [Verrucomicrobia bacterium]|nr:DUF1501 domain-containing protein [Cytophagales bacterium]
MERRDFLQQLGLISGSMAFGLQGIGVKAFAHPLLFDIEQTNGKILVLLQLNGGNDGLNTVIPFEDSIYYTKRPNIAIAKDKVLKIDEMRGFNPAMKAFQNLMNQNKLTVVQNVGYENPNRSHFRSTDIWLSGSTASEYIYDGWIGRYLSQAFPDFPAKIPVHPMAVQLGSVESMLLQSPGGSMGTVFENPNNFYQLVNGSLADNDPPPATLAGDELKYLKDIAAQSIQYSTVIKQAADKVTNGVTYPNTNIGRQLAIVAELIMGGLETPVYLTTLGGFDTHALQLTQHERLWQYVSEAVAAFQADIEKAGVADKVVLMTFSEFGRRVNENGSAGTDHGTAAPLFVIGKNVRGGFLGSNPSLTDLDTNGDIKYKYDFKQVYASILQQHLGIPAANTREILNKEYLTLPIFKNTDPTPTEQFRELPFVLNQNFPNPVNSITTIQYSL